MKNDEKDKKITVLLKDEGCMYADNCGFVLVV